MANRRDVQVYCGPNGDAVDRDQAAIYAGGACYRERILRGMHSGLATADLVSR